MLPNCTGSQGLVLGDEKRKLMAKDKDNPQPPRSPYSSATYFPGYSEYRAEIMEDRLRTILAEQNKSTRQTSKIVRWAGLISLGYYGLKLTNYLLPMILGQDKMNKLHTDIKNKTKQVMDDNLK